MNTDEVKQFWDSIEEELGQKIHIYTMGQYLGGYPDIDEALWGLVYLSDRELHFKHFPSNNWFSLLTRMGNSGGLFSRMQGNLQSKEVDFVIPFESLSKIYDIQRPGFFRKVFTNYTPELVVEYQLSDGKDRTLILSIEKDLYEFYEQLKKLSQASVE
ncbi:MAG: hypothetical protein K9L68_00375 [Spirochaetales bacterium]|nr:hypothetical protein [Spirochaetales bacterium]MCF7937031.1 hypothetical protein [Spirochaetales bacterium]